MRSNWSKSRLLRERRHRWTGESIKDQDIYDSSSIDV